MNVLVTGATGFVGSALARRLVEMGATVTALARHDSDRERLADVPVSWMVADVLDRDSLQGKFAGIEGVVHAAGMLGQAGVPEIAYHTLHVTGTRNVLAEATAANVARVLYVSSPGVLGPIPAGEAAADEGWPLAPSNPYERSKAAAETLAVNFPGLSVIGARPEFIYGPGDLHVLGLFRAVQRGMFFYIDGGRYLCHPTYIDDAVEGMLLALTHGKLGEVYHLTGPAPVTFRQLGDTIAAALGVQRPWLNLPRPLAHTGATMLEWAGQTLGFTPPLSRTGVAFFSENRHFSWQKAQRELGYTPHFSLEEGVRETVRWYKTQNLL